MTEDLLANMNISFSGFLKLKRTESRPVKSDSLGVDKLWSADMLYRHLQFLEGLVPRTVSFNHAYIIGSPLNRPYRMKPQHVCGSMLSFTTLLP